MNTSNSIRINPNAALDDAQQIDTIIEDIDKEMNELDRVIKNTIPDGIRTDWSEKVRQDWQSYYNESIPEAMAAMKVSATNLRLAVDKAIQYSKSR